MAHSYTLRLLMVAVPLAVPLGRPGFQGHSLFRIRNIKYRKAETNHDVQLLDTVR